MAGPRGLLTVDQAVQDTFGLMPNQDRLNILPRYSKKDGWVAPDMLYQAARAFVSPGVAARGGLLSEEDALNFGMGLLGSGVGASAVNPIKGRGILGINVYQGSPHIFKNTTPDAPYGKFDMSKIGTGEGAQAYGHGIYLAENPAVAKTYADELATADIFYADDAAEQALKAATNSSPEAAYALRSALSEHKGDATKVAAQLEWLASVQKYPDVADAMSKVATMVKEGKVGGKVNSYVYTADLPDEHIAKMLDWNAPLSEQPEAVRKFVGKIPSQPSENQPIGEWLKPRLAEGMAEYWAEDMRKAGIPGIKYFDGGSRASKEGTRNFVIFDPEIAKILKRE